MSIHSAQHKICHISEKHFKKATQRVYEAITDALPEVQAKVSYQKFLQLQSQAFFSKPFEEAQKVEFRIERDIPEDKLQKREETTVFMLIASRAINEIEGIEDYADPLSLYIRLTEVHEHACPINYLKLASAAKIDFTHDIIGMINEYNSETKSLGMFLPRFAAD